MWVDKLISKNEGKFGGEGVCSLLSEAWSVPGWVGAEYVGSRILPHPSEPEFLHLSEADLAPLPGQMVPQGGPSGSAYENE